MTNEQLLAIEVVQGTDAWLHARCGNVGASRVADVMAKLKSGGESASRRNYRAELVCELLTGKPTETYCSPEMQRGTELEPLARAAYEIARDVMVEQTGFILHPTVQRSGASPDGLVGDDGLMEIKCPKTATHIDYLLAGTAPSEYQLQMLWQMACTGRAWCDFVSYCPDLPTELALFIVRFDRDDKRIAELEDEVTTFNAEIDSVIAKLHRIAEGR